MAIKVVRAQGDERGTKGCIEADAMTAPVDTSVVELHGVGTAADGRAYLVMGTAVCPTSSHEFVRGMSRSEGRPGHDDQIQRRRRDLPLARLRAHDIKPSNIMLNLRQTRPGRLWDTASKVECWRSVLSTAFRSCGRPEQQDVNSLPAGRVGPGIQRRGPS